MLLQAATTPHWHFEAIIGLLAGNTVAIFTVIAKVYKNVNKARTHVHRQNWRVNILWQERLEDKNMSEDPIEKELFNDEFSK